MRSALAVIAVAVAIAHPTGPLRAQARPDSAITVAPVTAIAAPPPTLGSPISPRGAFLRAIVLPGWGHAAGGSYARGGFYVGAQGAALYTLTRIRIRRHEIEHRVAFREQVLRAQLAAGGITDPDAVDAALDDDGQLSDARNLLESRREQQEDLIALSIFLVLLSGADAYVSAHLSRFPAPLDIGARPTGDGRMEVALTVPLPR